MIPTPSMVARPTTGHANKSWTGAYQIADAGDVAGLNDRRAPTPPEIRLWSAVIERTHADLAMAAYSRCRRIPRHGSAGGCIACDAWEWVTDPASDLAALCDWLGVSATSIRSAMVAEFSAPMLRHLMRR